VRRAIEYRKAALLAGSAAYVFLLTLHPHPTPSKKRATHEVGFCADPGVVGEEPAMRLGGDPI
jgi:hypothetical protein